MVFASGCVGNLVVQIDGQFDDIVQVAYRNNRSHAL